MADAYTVKPLSPIRKVIAARMTEAKRTIPHFRLSCDIDMDAVLALREKMNGAGLADKVSVNDFVIKASASALMEHPAINIQWAETEIRQFHTADISVVIALEDGLSTPILRGVERKTVQEIAAEVKDLAARAAKGTLKMDEILGGSFSISNLGMYGIDQFDAIINPPQCTILAVGRAKPRVVASQEGETRIATIMHATLSVDHRAIDGVTAAAFLATVRRNLEKLE